MLSVASIDHWLAVIGVVLGAVAVLVGVLAIVFATDEGRRQISAMTQVRDSLAASVDDVREEVSTHYIGRFPDFMGEIVAVLEEADESITIFCDLPAYGVVSDPDGFRRYAEVIEAQAKRVEVRMLHLNPTGRMANLEIQSGDPSAWPATREEPKVAAFAASKGQVLGTLRRERFLELIEAEQIEALKRFHAAGVEAADTDLIMPLYFWIADGKRSVFALTQFTSEAYEAGFQTGSKNLIAAMDGIYVRYHASRTEAERGGVEPAAGAPPA